jgi:hypothetical protein
MPPINTPRPSAIYTCSQAELYSGLNSAWNSQAERETEFEAENTEYTPGISVTRKASIQAAKAMPDGQARYADSETFRLDMEDLLDENLGKWNSLEGYIKKAFKGSHFKPRIEEAGKNYYETAANQNWEDVGLLMEAGKNFIGTHSAVLIASGGMPVGFELAYNNKKSAFDTLYEQYKTAREDAQEQTDAKLNANNAIFKEGREMMDDGKHIFRKSASIRERFIWERILSMISPGGGAGIVMVEEGDVPGGGIVSIDLAELSPTDATMVKLEVTGSGLNLSASSLPTPIAGPVVWTLPIGTVTKTIDEFATLIGADDFNHFLKIQNFGPAGGHYKITFNHLG